MHYKYLDLNTDYILLQEFTKQCAAKKYMNNSSIDRLGLNKYSQSQFILGIVNNQVVSFFGCHSMDYRSEYLWRCGYRAVNLNKGVGKWASGGAISISLSMLWIKNNFGESRYITTTNTPSKSIETAGKSHRLDKVFRKSKGFDSKGFKVIEEEYYLNNTFQTIFELDYEYFINSFNKYKHLHTFEKDVICQ